jgi:Phosphoglycerol transferase and related proteins, alkaline phosphatase superfamily
MLPILFFMGSFIYVTFKWTKYYFGRHLDVEAIFFTLMLPLEGADQNIINSYLVLLGCSIPIIIALSYGYFYLLRRFSSDLPPGKKPSSGRPNRTGVYRSAIYALLIIAGLAYFSGAAYYMEHRKKLISFLLMPREYTDMFEQYYQPLEAQDVHFPSKRNIVLIILESMEETFNDEKLFGDNLIPGLARLRRENLSFYGSHETRGADWTAGALTAYSLGLPLAFARESTMSNFFGERASEFLPEASSILKILEAHDYQFIFFLGSQKEFSGKDKLIGSHSRAAIVNDFEYFELKKSNGEIDYQRSNWGAPDSVVYSEAKDYLSRNSGKAPFLLTVESVDTHLGDGHFNGLGERKWGDLRDCIVEADLMAVDFIRWIQQQSFYENTTIIVLGDHLLPRDRIGPVKLPDRNQREPYNTFINLDPSLVDDGKTKRNFGAFDLAPTILSAAGARWPGGRLGLGASLFQPDAQTLFELKGRAYYETEIRKKSAFYERLFAIEE